jgi:hypothetical protein
MRARPVKVTAFVTLLVLSAQGFAQEGAAPPPAAEAAKTEAPPSTPAPAEPPAAAPAETPAAAPAVAAPAAVAPGTSEAKVPETAAPKSGLDFDLLPASTAPQEDKGLESQLHLRRSMLLVHQALGIATFLLITTSVVFGQLNYDDRFGGGSSTGNYEVWHSGFAAAGTITFISAGTLALLAPVPIAKRGDFDTITVHKWSMLVAAVGFAAEIPLGIYTVSQEGHANQASLALAHLIIGYITAAALGVGTAALLF